MSDLLERVWPVFEAETREQLQALSAGVVELEGAPEAGAVVPLRRIAHTMKGTAASLGLHDIERTAHAVEDVLGLADAVGGLPPGAVEAVLRAARAMEESLSAAAPGRIGDVEEVLAGLGAAAAPPEGASAPARGRPAPAPGAPVPDDHPASAETARATSARTERRSVRVEAARLDAVAADADQLSVGVSRRERIGKDLARTADALRDALLLVEQGLDDAGVPREPRPRALVEGLERLRDRGVELGREARELRREAERERLSARSLRDTLQELRMVPAEAALQALRPVVREVAAQLGKQVALELSGGEVRLDRRVLDELRAPLLHLVRNALDHGIEAPEARRAAGKREVALLAVRVESRGDRAVVTVRDDGAGISPERLRAAAVQRGAVSAEEAARLDDAAALRLALRPGVSTAAEVTALSGRGIGLDVVAEAVRHLGGGVDVSSERGRGASFVIDVPLMLTGTTGLLFRAGGGLALIATEAVERVLLVAPGDLGTVAGELTVCVEGDQVPFARLAQLLGGSGAPAGQGTAVALLVAASGRRVAFAVDEVLGEQAIVVSALGRRMASASHVAGAAVLDDGRVVSVLQASQLVGAARVPEEARGPTRARIIVADDSLGTRAAMKAILEIAGFLVLPAADGEEALALAREAGCDLVVSDVQMPRLDGVALTRRLKSDPKLSRIPVILVTSLDAAEDRAAGLDAGADGYLVKRDVQHGKLLDLVRQLLPA